MAFSTTFINHNVLGGEHAEVLEGSRMDDDGVTADDGVYDDDDDDGDDDDVHAWSRRARSGQRSAAQRGAGGAARREAMERSVRVRDLPETATEALLRALFVPFGEVAEVRLRMARGPGGRAPACLGDALVTMAEPEDAAAACDNLHQSEVFGKVIRVQQASAQDLADLGAA